MLKSSCVLLLALLFPCGDLSAGSGSATGGSDHVFVAHKFQLWGQLDKAEKLNFFMGWSNGFFQARGALDFANCLESMTTEQATAMIDKYYQDHPELWSRPIGGELLEALTVQGGPCEGKNPLAPSSQRH